MKNNLLIFFLLLSGWVQSQVFTGTGGPIRNDSTITVFNAVVSGVNTLTTLNGLKRVSLNITHPAVQELHIYLRSPSGFCIALSIGNGNGANYSNTIFDNSAGISIRNGTPPFSGLYKPESSLAVFNTNNVTANGTWTLNILDDQKYMNSGNVVFFSLEFGINPAQPTIFRQSTLPVFVINTRGKTIPLINDSIYKMYILNSNSGVNNLSDTQTTPVLPIGIHIRGNSSSGGLKDPYSFSPKDIYGNDSDMSILGMPSENDWILNNAYQDQSFMRDVLSYYLSNRLGRYDSRTRFCELVINGNYQGVYCLMEKIKQGKNRVDISKLKITDTSGVEVTGGYILKKDGSPGIKDSGFFHTLSGYYYLYEDPDSPAIQQKKYIKSWMDTCVTALNTIPFTDTIHGYRGYVDYKSVIDYIILNELGVSGDTYQRSVYWNKNKITKGNKLVFGPSWDFNFGWVSINNGFKFPTFTPWKKMYDDTFFKKELWCRYNEARATILNPANINNVIDSFIAPLYDAMYRNDERWFQNKTGGAIIQSCYYKDACYFLKKYSFDRLHFMDSFMRNSCLYVRNTCRPILNYSITNTCFGDSVILLVNTTSNQVFVYPSSGVTKVTNYKFKIKPDSGIAYKLIWNNCTSFDTAKLSITGSLKPSIQCSGLDSVIAGDSILLVMNGALSYSWSPTVNFTNATGDSVYVKPFGTTLYTITGYSGSGCSISITKKVNVIPRYKMTLFSSADSLCSGTILKLKATGAEQYIWDINGKLTMADSLILYPSVNLIIKLTGMVNNVQSDFIVKTIKVFPFAQLIFKPTSPVYYGSVPVMIIVSGAVTYDWNPKQGLDRYDNDTVYASPASTTLYTVNAVDANSCLTWSTINVRSAIGIGNNNSIPSFSFYPDPVNDKLIIRNSGEQEPDVFIYNAIGKLVLKAEVRKGETIINTSNWATGIYFAKIGDVSYKIIKQ